MLHLSIKGPEDQLGKMLRAKVGEQERNQTSDKVVAQRKIKFNKE
jgi:hypothetical protein